MHEITKEYRDAIKNRIHGLKRDRTLVLDKILVIFPIYYGTLGQCELIMENDLVAAKQAFYKAARVIEFLFENWQGKYNYSQTTPALSETQYLITSYVILSDNTPFFKHFFETVQHYEDEYGVTEKNNNYSTQLALAFKEFAKGDFEQAIPFLYRALDPKLFKNSGPLKGFETVLLGIIKADKTKIIEGVRMNLNHHIHTDPERFRFPEFCLEATAMCKLAHLYGFNVEINSRYIRQDLIPHNPCSNYEDIHEIFKALQPKKAWWDFL
jgi:hypothetical protein